MIGPCCTRHCSNTEKETVCLSWRACQLHTQDRGGKRNRGLETFGARSSAVINQCLPIDFSRALTVYTSWGFGTWLFFSPAPPHTGQDPQLMLLSTTHNGTMPIYISWGSKVSKSVAGKFCLFASVYVWSNRIPSESVKMNEQIGPDPLLTYTNVG